MPIVYDNGSTLFSFALGFQWKMTVDKNKKDKIKTGQCVVQTRLEESERRLSVCLYFAME